MLKSKDAEISSAEMTAFWRSLFPRLSGDSISVKLASVPGIQKAKIFEDKFDYPLVGRKVSVRAGFILEKSVEILSTGHYDSCISLGSGFSLLTYLVSKKMKERKSLDIQFIDSDLPEILEERKSRISTLTSDENISNSVISQIHHVSADLEKMHTEGVSFGMHFQNCKRPLFIIEGLLYFLTIECVEWIIREITSYDMSAIIFDYWPADGVFESLCFRNAISSMSGFMPETIKSFWSTEGVEKLSNSFNFFEIKKIQSLEHEMSEKDFEEPKFVDKNRFFPVQIFVAKNNSDSLIQEKILKHSVKAKL